MAWSLISSGSAGSPDTLAASASGLATSGADLIVVGGSWYPGGGELGAHLRLVDNQANSWNRLTIMLSSNTAAVLYYAVSPTTAGSHTFTFDSNNGAQIFPSLDVLAFSGVKTADAFDSETGNTTASGTTLKPGSITPAAADDLFVTFLSSLTTSDPTLDSSFTVQEIKNYSATHYIGSAIGYKFVSGSGAQDPQWTFGSSDAAAVMAAFKVDSGGAPPPTRAGRMTLLGCGA